MLLTLSHWFDGCSVAQRARIVKQKILHDFFMDMELGGPGVRLYRQRIRAAAYLKEILRFSDCTFCGKCGTIVGNCL